MSDIYSSEIDNDGFSTMVKQHRNRYNSLAAMYRWSIGNTCVNYGVGLSKTSKFYGISRQNAYYWRNKYLYRIHDGDQGGDRSTDIDKFIKSMMEPILWKTVTDDPDGFTLRRLVIYLNQLGFKVSKSTLSRTFRRWRWSWKVPTRFNINKYSPDNIERYINYILWIQNKPWLKIKYLDECHFVSRHVHKKLGIGPVGKRITVVKSCHIKENYSLTALSTLSNYPYPLYFDIRQESNTQWDFAKFLTVCIEEQKLVDGGYLIIDNASIHSGNDIWRIYAFLLEFI